MPKKIYLAPNRFRQSKYHTAYVGNGASRQDGKTKVESLVFEGGVARNVEEAIFQRFKDAGIATDKRPRRPDEEDDE